MLNVRQHVLDAGPLATRRAIQTTMARNQSPSRRNPLHRTLRQSPPDPQPGIRTLPLPHLVPARNFFSATNAMRVHGGTTIGSGSTQKFRMRAIGDFPAGRNLRCELPTPTKLMFVLRPAVFTLDGLDDGKNLPPTMFPKDDNRRQYVIIGSSLTQRLSPQPHDEINAFALIAAVLFLTATTPGRRPSPTNYPPRPAPAAAKPGAR